MGVGTTYSFKDLVGSITNPVFAETILLSGGNVGVGSISITMDTARTSFETAADGTVMPSYIAGNSGKVDIVCQQTSLIHKQLLNLYNKCQTAADAFDITGWSATTVAIRTMLDGSSHKATGVSFEKIPDKPYEAQGKTVTWVLMAANIVSTGNTLQTAITSLASGIGL